MKGRRSSKTVLQRQEAFRKACNVSGFTGFELLQILTDWYGWREVTVYSGMTRQTVTNSTTLSDGGTNATTASF